MRGAPSISRAPKEPLGRGRARLLITDLDALGSFGNSGRASPPARFPTSRVMVGSRPPTRGRSAVVLGRYQSHRLCDPLSKKAPRAPHPVGMGPARPGFYASQ